MSLPESPGADEARRGWDWRDTMTVAADFALLGIALCVAAIPMVTAGAAVSVGSFATDHWYRYRSMPPIREMAGRYLRGIPAGLVATLVALLAGGLLVAEASAIARGAVPGGRPLLWLSLAVAAEVAGLAGLTVVNVAGTGWWPAARAAVRTGLARPLVPLALAGPLALAALLAVLVPVTAPILVGYVIFALHVVARRTRARGH